MTVKDETTHRAEDGLLDFKADSKTIRRSAFDSILIQLLFKLKGIITMPIITYYLTPDKLGAFNLILLTSSLLVPIFSMNLTDGPAIHFVQEQTKKRIIIMYNTVTNSVVLLALLFLPVFWFSMRGLGDEWYSYAPLMVLLLYSNLAYKLVTYVLAVFQKTSKLVKNSVLKDGVATILSILSVIAGYSYSGMVAALVVSNIGAALLVYRYTRHELVYAPVIDKEILMRFLKTSIPLLPVFFFSWIIQSSDSYFLAYFQGQESVGKYSVIYGLTSVILSLTFALNFFWFPVSARLWVEEREKYRNGFVALFLVFSIALFILVCLFELNSGLIMRVLVTRREYYDAHIIMGIIAFAFSMQVLITLLTAPLYSNGNTKSIFISYLCGGIVNTAMNMLLIPSTGIIGAAISTAVAYLLLVLLMAWMNYLVAGFHFLDKRLVSVCLAFLFVWCGVAWLRGYLSLYQILLLNVFLLMTSCWLLYARVLKCDEKKYIQGIFKASELRLHAKA